MATTAGTVIVAIGILNIALAIGLKIPRILSPYANPAKGVASTITQEISPLNDTQSLKIVENKVTKEEVPPTHLNSKVEKQLMQ